jgi:hypothetical protein
MTSEERALLDERLADLERGPIAVPGENGREGGSAANGRSPCRAYAVSSDAPVGTRRMSLTSRNSTST